MAFRDILVHLDNGAGSANRLATAIALAQTHEAHLIGLHVPSQLKLPSAVSVHFPPELSQAFVDNERQKAQESKAEFDSATNSAQIGAEWRTDAGYLTHVIQLHARYADLVVMGQEEDYLPWLDDVVTDTVVMSCGRPTLVVPAGATEPETGKRVYVAWDGSREAVRAVHDSLPVLTHADEVKVVAVDAISSPKSHGEQPCADICLHLARHGVEATAYPIDAGSLSVGEALLKSAAEEAIDLIVMGAYGHSRVREVVLGGTTAHCMQHMNVPILLSH